MSTVLAQPRPEARRGGAGSKESHRAAWALILGGLAALYAPTYVDLARGLWRDDAYAHGPIVLAVFTWLVWRSRDALSAAATAAEIAAGAPPAALGLPLSPARPSQPIPLFQAPSPPPPSP